MRLAKRRLEHAVAARVRQPRMFALRELEIAILLVHRLGGLRGEGVEICARIYGERLCPGFAKTWLAALALGCGGEHVAARSAKRGHEAAAVARADEDALARGNRVERRLEIGCCKPRTLHLKCRLAVAAGAEMP